MSVPVPAPSAGTDTRRAPVWVLSIFLVGVLVFVGFFVDAFASNDAERIQGMLVVPVLIALTIPIALRIARSTGDQTYFGIVMAALTAKLVFALVRYYVAFELYNGQADMVTYHNGGLTYVDSFRRFVFPQTGDVIGTTWIKVFTGFVYSLSGSSIVSGGFVYAWIGFIGFVLLTRAFALAIPGGDARRYTILVLFLPSLLYWPASIGKESWMMFGIGLSSYGIASIYARRSIGAVWFALGIGAVILVRPHIALVEFVGVVFAYALRRSPDRSLAGAAFRIVGVLVIVALGLFLANRTATFFGQERLSVDTQLTDTATRTSEGGSQFDPVVVRTPLDLVPAFATVFFRPFVFEAGSGQELLSALECVGVFVLLAASWNRLRSIPRLVRTTPYLSYSIGYVAAFTFAFASFANFGILARQRVQAVPFLLVLVALPRFRDLLAADAPPIPDEPVLQVVPEAPTEVPRFGPQHRSRRPPRPGVTAPAIGGRRADGSDRTR